ncbi:hypothetical protein CONPUDRAFT_159655 [Coniophora puteana RWD-64-598 SS2]|uniref:Uncharacterized protein n=1 Tax=Coniophora puteana (strain RWD-64-598) TaxID=741705 RepID=A0A5M3M7W8_CONPW|nr:uncharacterized protein CONPUDRAFT_159655 [Coniophora puteana RWD-64-598 SS2]EIW74880.1 hypothetical protein CONPUDRAFT_159655 [Coniophora puteana RWD-64-598 SS2]
MTDILPAYEQAFSKDIRGTLLNDMLAFEDCETSSGGIPTPHAEAELRDLGSVEFQLLEQWINNHDERAASHIRPEAHPKVNVGRAGETYSIEGKAQRNSYIVYRVAGNDGPWKAGVIRAIFDHTRKAPGNHSTTQTFFLVFPLRPLPDRLLPYDYYRAFPEAPRCTALNPARQHMRVLVVRINIRRRLRVSIIRPHPPQPQRPCPFRNTPAQTRKARPARALDCAPHHDERVRAVPLRELLHLMIEDSRHERGKRGLGHAVVRHVHDRLLREPAGVHHARGREQVEHEVLAVGWRAGDFVLRGPDPDLGGPVDELLGGVRPSPMRMLSLRVAPFALLALVPTDDG